MDILDTVNFDGPNRWAGVPVFAARLRLEAWTPARQAELRRHLADWLPTLDGFIHFTTNLSRQGDVTKTGVVERFSQRLAHDIGPAECVQFLSQVLQLATGVMSVFGATQPTADPHVFEVAFQFEDASLARAALDTAILLVFSADSPVDLRAVVRVLVDLADDVRLGPSTRTIVRAALERGIPYRRLSTGSLVQLGEGRRQRRICTAETDATSAIAEGIACDKELTKRLLDAVGVPVPRGRPVESAADAWAAAQELGVPVVVKPRRANHARGVSLDLTTREQLETAYDWAIKVGEGRDVLVEQFAPGTAYRLLVIGGRLAAALRSEREFLTGDGRQTIRQLINQANQDPRRGENYTDLLDTLGLNGPALLELEKQGLTPESIPAAGQRVLLQAIGDYVTDCTDEVHPANAAHAVLAARMLGLDIAGLDVVATDLGRPLEEQRGAILEVNAGPSLGIHLAPLNGQSRPVGEMIVEMLFPHGTPGRIPIVCVTGQERGGVAPQLPSELRSNSATAALEQVAKLLQGIGKSVGHAGPSGVFVNGRRIGNSHSSDRQNVESLLLNPDVEVAVFASRASEAARLGLGCSAVDLALVIDPPDDSETRDGMLAVVHAVPPNGTAILPDTPVVRESLAPACRGRVAYFGSGGPWDTVAAWVRGTFGM